MAKEFEVEILTPDRSFFKGLAESLVLTTSHGEMGILYNTMPTVTTLKDGVIKINQKGQWREAYCGEGYVNVGRGVTVLASAAEWPYEIDAAKAGAEIGGADEQLKKMQSLREYKMAKAQLARQFARLRIKDKGTD